MLHSEFEANDLLKMTPKIDNFRFLLKLADPPSKHEPLSRTRIAFDSPTPTDEDNADRDFGLHDVPAFQDDAKALGVLIKDLCAFTVNCPPSIQKLALSLSERAVEPFAIDQKLVSKMSKLLHQFLPETKRYVKKPVEVKLPEILLGGRYKLEEQIGSGGFGVVGKYWDHKFEIYVAIKIAKDRQSNLLEQSLESEVLGMAKSLEHRGFAKILNCFQINRPGEVASHAIVMQFIDGQSLSDAKLHLQKLLPEARTRNAIKWIKQIGDAVGFLHKKEIVHRDLKPGNILIDAKNNALVIDLGLALTRFVPLNNELSRSGTPGYISPERAQFFLNEIKICPPQTTDDVYAIGCIFFELLTGSPLFSYNKTIVNSDERRCDLLRRIASNNHNACASLEASGVSDSLIKLIENCVATDPKGRPTSGADFVARLAEQQANAEQVNSQRNLTGQWIAIGAFLLSFAALIWLGTSPWNNSQPTSTTQQIDEVAASKVNWYRGRLPQVKAFEKESVIINAGEYHGIATETIFGVLGASLRDIPKSDSFRGYIKVTEVQPFASKATPISHLGLGIPDNIPIDAKIVPVEFPEPQPLAKLFISPIDNSGKPVPEKVLGDIRADLGGTGSKLIRFVDSAELANWQIRCVSPESFELEVFPVRTRSAVCAITNYSFFKAMRPLRVGESWAEDFIETFEHLIRVNEFIELAQRSTAISPIRENEFAISLKVDEDTVLEPSRQRHQVAKGQKLELTVSNKRDQPIQLRIIELTPQLKRDRFFPLQPAEKESGGVIEAKESMDVEFEFSSRGETELIFIVSSADVMIDDELLFDDGYDYVRRSAQSRSLSESLADIFLVDVDRLFGGSSQRSSRRNSASSAAVGLLLMEIVEDPSNY